MRTPLRLVPVLALASVSAAQDAELPPEVRAWLAEAAHPLASFDPGADPGELAPLADVVGDARLVLVGEATHGSGEFFRFKHRLFAWLVAERGFTDFVMETDWTQALAANAWVERGEGDLATALRGLAGLWRTEEYRDLLLWMRAWNERGEGPTVRLSGMDMQQPPQAAADLVVRFLERADPGLAEAIGPVIADIGALAPLEELDLEGVPATLDELEPDLVAATSQGEFDLARQALAVALQRYRQGSKQGYDSMDWRDVCMAENVRWIVERAGPGGGVLVSAHNGHVSRAGLSELGGRTIQSVGRALAADGPPMVVLGTAFAHGAFDASPASGGPPETFRIDAPRPDSLESLLLAAGLERALLDLAAAPAGGPVRAWLDTPRPSVSVGGAWDPAWLDQPGYARATALPAEYDALLFVAETTAAARLGL